MNNSSSNPENRISIGLAVLAFLLACLSMAVQTLTGTFAAVVVTGCLVALIHSSIQHDEPAQRMALSEHQTGPQPSGTGRLRVSNRGGL